MFIGCMQCDCCATLNVCKILSSARNLLLSASKHRSLLWGYFEKEYDFHICLTSNSSNFVVIILNSEIHEPRRVEVILFTLDKLWSSQISGHKAPQISLNSPWRKSELLDQSPWQAKMDHFKFEYLWIAYMASAKLLGHLKL